MNLMYGTQLLSSADRLVAVDETFVYNMLVNPSEGFCRQMEQLDAIRMIDEKQYKLAKRSLPYIVCGSFSPEFRRTENFINTDCFVVDIDHLSDKGLDVQAVRNILHQDSRVVCSFVSPSRDGIKVLFGLKEKCCDSELFKLFYKMFIQRFSTEHGFEQAIDSRTCDVTRACFLSIDKDAYFNPQADLVDIDEFLHADDMQFLLDMNRTMKFEDVNQSKSDAEEVIVYSDPDDETMAMIRQTLSLRKRPVVPKPEVYVPDELNMIIDRVVNGILQTGIEVSDIIDIQYGKKIHVKLGIHFGEINLFYGKNGFTVVQSPKRGTSPKLNQLAAEIIDACIMEYENEISNEIDEKINYLIGNNNKIPYICE